MLSLLSYGTAFSPGWLTPALPVLSEPAVGVPVGALLRRGWGRPLGLLRRPGAAGGTGPRRPTAGARWRAQPGTLCQVLAPSQLRPASCL